MLTEERKQRIIALLSIHGIVKTQDLMVALDASESTVRRDLQELEEAALLVRIHGGAKKKQHLFEEPTMNEKSSKNIKDKRVIAQKAVSLIKDGDVIYLDAGSTTYEMVKLLTQKKLTVVTNSVKHAAALIDQKVPTIILGGAIKLPTHAIIGDVALAQLKTYRVNKAFLGMNGCHLTFGFTTPDPEERAIKKAAIEQAEQSFMLVDATKFEETSFSHVADLNNAAIITTNLDPKLHLSYSKYTTIMEANK